jgi:butyryl-CoA dehydrogenase
MTTPLQDSLTLSALSPELRALRDKAARFSDEVVEPRAKDIDLSDDFPWDVMEAAHREGFLALTVPPEFGGGGASLTEAVVVIEEIARNSMSVSVPICANITGGLYLRNWPAPQRLQRQLYEPMADGKLLAFAGTEPQAGTDPASYRTTAVRDGDIYRLNGQKWATTNGGVAEVYIVFAMTEPGARNRGMSAFVVNGDSPGLKLDGFLDKCGWRGCREAELTLENLEVPVENRIGDEGEGFKVLMKCFEMGRITVAANCIGLAQGAFDYAFRYAQQREAFQQKIVDFQAIQNMLADAAIGITTARLLLHRVTEAWDNDDRQSTNLQAAMAKHYAVEVAKKTTTDMVDVLGGHGFVRDHPVERMWRDHKAFWAGEGAQPIQRQVIVKELQGRYPIG